MSYSVASTSTALRASTSSPNGSRTMTITVDPTTDDSEVGGSQAEDSGGGAANAVLILRGARNAGPRVAWDNDVVDNEHMGKKKSKICCIYHKPRRFDESSSESSSEGESDSDASAACGGEGHNHDRRSHRHRHHHHRRRPHNHRHKPQDRNVDGECGDELDANAYERQPRGKGKGNP